MVHHITEPDLAGVSKRILNLVLFDHAATAKHFGGIQVFDAAGRYWTHNSETLNPKPENRANEDYFKVHRDNPDAGLLIGLPGMHKGAYSMVLSRRITGKDGSFQGVVVGSLRASYFHDLLGRLMLAPDDIITVIRQDGVVVMRRPFDVQLIGTNLSSKPGVKRMFAEHSGSFSGKGPFDAVERLFIWRDNSHPLVVVVENPGTISSRSGADRHFAWAELCCH